MNEKTINGKSLAAVSAELAAAFPEERLKKRRHRLLLLRCGYLHGKVKHCSGCYAL